MHQIDAAVDKAVCKAELLRRDSYAQFVPQCAETIVRSPGCRICIIRRHSCRLPHRRVRARMDGGTISGGRPLVRDAARRTNQGKDQHSSAVLGIGTMAGDEPREEIVRHPRWEARTRRGHRVFQQAAPAESST